MPPGFLLQIPGKDGERPDKPNGQAVITPKNGPAFVEALEVKKFQGVGPATAAKMERLGLLTGADLKAKSLDFLQANFGKSGGWYYRISRGIDERPVQPDRPRKSVGAEDTFMVDIFDLEAAKSELVPLAEKVWRHCEAKGLSGRTLTLKVKFADFQQITRSRTFHATTSIYSSAEIALLCSGSDPGQIDEMIRRPEKGAARNGQSIGGGTGLQREGINGDGPSRLVW